MKSIDIYLLILAAAYALISIPHNTHVSAFITQTNKNKPNAPKHKVNLKSTLLNDISQSMSKALNKEVSLKPTSGGGASGGGGASVSAATDENTNVKYFIKTASIASGGSRMLRAEYLGVKEIHETGTIKVPKPIVFGEGGELNTAYVVFEYLEFVYSGSGYDLGVQLANMHQCTKDQFGFHIDNTIGATPQPNTWCDNWADFWDKERLGYMLSKCSNAGYDQKTIDKLRKKTIELLGSHDPVPSLLHGDLWGGNKGFAKVGDEVIPVIFDPAVYYGDCEVDIAMTHLFGSFGKCSVYQMLIRISFDLRWNLNIMIYIRN